MKTQKNLSVNYKELAALIRLWSRELEFQTVQMTDIDLSHYQSYFIRWLHQGYQGDMHFMDRHLSKRLHPNELLKNTCRIITVGMNYLSRPSEKNREDKTTGGISQYALGQDYHTIIHDRLRLLARKIETQIGHFNYRVFVDSAPVLEKALAEKAGIGWIGKNTIIISKELGSWMFLGEIFVDIPLPIDAPINHHCGQCQICLEKCPTKALVAPYTLDARRCIAYLTIEHKGVIPLELRKLIGNRIFGCDECQLSCPWNENVISIPELHFAPRLDLKSQDLLELFSWDELIFRAKTKGTVIQRICYEQWLRNIAVALGNAPFSLDIIEALKTRLYYPSELVQEHVRWAIDQQLLT